MYDPLNPNEYKQAKLALYKSRPRDMADAMRPPASTSLNLFAEALSALPSSSAVSSNPQAPSQPVAVTASVEELLRRRVARSAAMGSQSAEQMEREELEVEQKKRKLEGSDIRSRVGSFLSKMRAPAAKAADASAAMPQASPSAPLAFVPSPLAAGGYVMAATTAAPVPRTITGRASTTLLLRYVSNSPFPQLRGLVGEALERMCGPLCSDVSAECGQYGVVRAVRVYLLRSEEIERVRQAVEAVLSDKAQVEKAILCEQVRIVVRFGALKSAFAASEALPQRHPECVVSFFPEAMFDAGRLGPIEGEVLCGV